ncbi:nitrilase [Rhizodiscina lignyota]|uniref:Nitrilase n=1 Tax=Rhizodiscina lignyota TaxID=1504668 RepID=A0A9P4M120_9PEZI|nr:nitrilase [Rhizodiscina lignyota]
MAVAAVGQICSTGNMLHNLKQCRTLVQKAAAKGAKALFLPEASDYIASSPAETVSLVKSVQESEFVRGLQEEARSKSIAINVGVHEPAEGGKKVKNTLLWIDEKGEIVQRYQKLHLFDVELPGGPVIRESDSVEKGSSILPPFDSALGRIGMTICFDLRFPEISLALKRQNAQVITYPSAFTVPTGKAHWAPLLRARAIETQAYVIAAAQVGFHNVKRRSYGHSVIISPWGEMLAELGYEELKRDGNGDPIPEIAFADIDLKEVERIRKEMPLLRRTDMYPEV